MGTDPVPGSDDDEERAMGVGEKFENIKDDMVGKAKEAEGKLTGDTSREKQGKMEQSKADLNKAGENVKDAFKN